MDYGDFLESKRQCGMNSGIRPSWIPEFLFDFQADLVSWAINHGRSALFEECGLGKTPQQLVWAENIVRHTGKPVLILTPLTVSMQTMKEAEKFGVEAIRSRDGSVGKNITITNYQQLDKFDYRDFSGVVCDEGQILKSFDGAIRNAITEFMRKVPYRLLASATPAPNDYIELGTSSEALGHLGHIDMLNRFFKNDRNNVASRRMYGVATEWRFKGHAETMFWRWVCSWARAIRKPSDLGYDDTMFVLPELIENDHIINPKTAPTGMLFTLPAHSLSEQRDEERRTINERCEMAATIANDNDEPVIVAVNRNAEGDLAEKLIRGSVQISGSDSDEEQEEKLTAFLAGQARALISKHRIIGLGLNLQHCAHIINFPNHSYEQYYQLIRRCYRFGQKRPVVVDNVLTTGLTRVRKNQLRKARQADAMFDRLVGEMNRSMSIVNDDKFNKRMELPLWAR